MTLKITNVKHKKGTTTVAFEENKGGDVVKSTLESDVLPVPELLESMASLGKHMTDLMGFTDDWKKETTCTSVAIGHEKDEKINAIVTLSVKLEKFNNGITVNTPVMREKKEGIPGGGSFMSLDMLALVKAVIAHGQKYIDGERAQQSLLERKEKGSRAAKAGGPPAKEEAQTIN